MATKEGATKPKQQVTVRQRRLADAIVKDAKSEKPLSRTELLRVAGYSPSTSAAGVQKAFTSQGLQVALAERGVTVDKVARVLDDALDADQGAWFKGQYQTTDKADHAIRLRAVDQFADVMGMKSQRLRVESVNVTLDSADIAALLGISPLTPAE